jgi:hypothetical protein
MNLHRASPRDRDFWQRNEHISDSLITFVEQRLPVSKDPDGNRVATVGVEAPCWPGARSAHAGCM